MQSLNAETKKIILRDIVAEDFTNLKKVYNDPSVLRYLARIPFDDNAIKERLVDMINYRKLNLQSSSAIIDKNTNEFIGFIRIDFYPTIAYVKEHNNQIKGIINELSPGGHIQSAYLLSNYQNKGYMTEVIGLLTDYLRKNKIKYMFGSVHNKNIAVKKLLDKFKFRYISTAPINLESLQIPLSINSLNDEHFAISEIK
ncbi:MAG: N-acetyltransferase [Hymenobacter sp.]|nr:MAG: N-acetyltransferase [Hymenobacter sp.]